MRWVSFFNPTYRSLAEGLRHCASHKSNLTQRLAHAFVPRRFSESRQESLRGGVPPVLSRIIREETSRLRAAFNGGAGGRSDARTPLFPEGLAHQRLALLGFPEGLARQDKTTPRSGFCLRLKNRNPQVYIICRNETHKHISPVLNHLLRTIEKSCVWRIAPMRL